MRIRLFAFSKLVHFVLLGPVKLGWENRLDQFSQGVSDRETVSATENRRVYLASVDGLSWRKVAASANDVGPNGW